MIRVSCAFDAVTPESAEWPRMAADSIVAFKRSTGYPFEPASIEDATFARSWWAALTPSN